MDCSLPGSSVHGIFQARVLEWVDIAFSSHKQGPAQTSKDGLWPHLPSGLQSLCPVFLSGGGVCAHPHCQRVWSVLPLHQRMWSMPGLSTRRCRLCPLSTRGHGPCLSSMPESAACGPLSARGHDLCPLSTRGHGLCLTSPPGGVTCP